MIDSIRGKALFNIFFVFFFCNYRRAVALILFSRWITISKMQKFILYWQVDEIILYIYIYIRLIINN